MERSIDRNSFQCSKADMCQNVQDESAAVRCPNIRNKSDAERYFESSPMLLSERLCIRALTEYTQVASNRDPFKQNYNDSIYHLEVALAHYDEEERYNNFEAFSRYNNEILNETDPWSNGRFTYTIGAQVLDIYSPAFLARLEDRKPNVAEMSAVHSDLCRWIEDFDDNVLSNFEKRDYAIRTNAEHFRTEAELAALMSRMQKTELFPWPALPREEASHRRSEYNHDYYVIDEQGLKRPLQFKTFKGRGNYKIPVVTHQQVLSCAKRDVENISYVWEDQNGNWPPDRYQHKQRLLPPLVPSIRDLLLEEFYSGKNMNPDHKSLLNLASMHIVAAVDNYRQP